MSAPRSAIEGIEFFSGLDQRLLKKVAESAIVSEYAADEMIIREGELGLGMYVITRGRVAVTHDDNGRTIKLAELGANQCFAEMALIDDKPRSANVVTVEETECLLFTRDTFLKLMEKHPALSIRLARTLAARLRAMDRPTSSPPAPVAVAPPLLAPPAAPVVVVATNGTHPSGPSPSDPIPSDSNGDRIPDRKARIQEQLLNAFSRLYTAKALTRFSVALIGCPVRCSSPAARHSFSVDDVKVLILPAEANSTVSIDAWGAGMMHIDLFSPEQPEPRRLCPIAVEPRDRFELATHPVTLSRNGQAVGVEFL